MKRIYDKPRIEKYIEKHQIYQYFDTPDLTFFACRYQKGEFLNQSDKEETYLQFIVDGIVSIYFVREDGSKYSLECGDDLLLIGEMAFASPPPSPFLFYAEAVTEVTSIVISLEQHRTALQKDRRFLNFLVYVLSRKLSLVTGCESISLPLEERVLNHMKYYCQDGILNGIEKTAFRLHCSSRHLQRVLNYLEQQKIVEKCAKGTYRLL